MYLHYKKKEEFRNYYKYHDEIYYQKQTINEIAVNKCDKQFMVW